MIPNRKLRSVDSKGVDASAEFGISIDDSTHLMTILRDTLYSDKHLAVMREYSANAWDAHREAGKGDVPIKVTIPTSLKPTLEIQDFGIGLSHEDVFHVYTKYGASTKRTNDKAVGMLGIGSKSAFAYSDSFTIVAKHGGSKRIYVAVLDESDKGVINLQHEEPCDEDDRGVSIQIAVKPEDIWEFTRKARDLFRYFVPRPDINIDLPPEPSVKMALTHGVVYELGEDHDEHSWVAVMGCVPYHINMSQLDGLDVAEFLNKMSGALYFEIGEVQFNASREELKYSDSTKKALVSKFNLLVEEYVKQTLHVIKSSAFSPWERRLRAQVLRKLFLPVPDDCKELIASAVSLKDKVGKRIEITQMSAYAATSISVSERTRFLLYDDRRKLKGFNLNAHEYLVRPTDTKLSWDEVRKDLDEVCVKADLTGIPIAKLSDQPWVTPTKTASGRTINAKHRQKAFKCLFEKGAYRPYSDGWEAIEFTPSDKDVFVRISGFQAMSGNFRDKYRDAQKLMKTFGGTMPTIYGYKHTQKKPIEDKDCVGIPFDKWFDDYVKSLFTPTIEKNLLQAGWEDGVEGYSNWGRGPTDLKISKKLTKEFGKKHALTDLFRRHFAAKTLFRKKKQLRENLSILMKYLPDDRPEHPVDAALKAIHETYPLFDSNRFSFSELWGDNEDKWSHYVHAVDAYNKSKT